MADDGVQTLHASGHAAGRDAVNLGNLIGTANQADALTLSQVVLVGCRVGGGQLGVLSEGVGHFVHETTRFQAGRCGSNDRVCQVEHGREGGTVAQPRCGGGNQRIAAYAAGGNLDHVTNLATQLCRENTDVLLGGLQGFNGHAETAGGTVFQVLNGVFGAHSPYSYPVHLLVRSRMLGS